MSAYYSNFGSNAQFKGAVKNLIIINVVVFTVIHLSRSIPWVALFGLVPQFVLTKFFIWQPVTYLFLHAGLWHLVLNMLMLWMFGTVVENTWGSKRFLFYYFFTGIGAGLCSILFAWNSYTPVVGASGAIFGLLVAFAVLFPESIILLFFIFPMKMKYAAIVLAGINLLGALSNQGAGIAYVAHLGGGLFGYLYLKNERLRMMFSKLDFDHFKSEWIKKEQIKKQTEEQDASKEIDRILDKISAQGMASLTLKERNILAKRSEKK